VSTNQNNRVYLELSLSQAIIDYQRPDTIRNALVRLTLGVEYPMFYSPVDAEFLWSHFAKNRESLDNVQKLLSLLSPIYLNAFDDMYVKVQSLFIAAFPTTFHIEEPYLPACAAALAAGADMLTRIEHFQDFEQLLSGLGSFEVHIVH
jgi:hypothetical protein